MAKQIVDHSFDLERSFGEADGFQVGETHSLLNAALQKAAGSVTGEEAAVIEQVRAYVHQASQLLKSLDADRARVGWLLEDALMYLDEMDAEALFDRIEPLDIDQAIALPRTAPSASK